MKTFKIELAERIYKNNGQHLEYCLRVMFGETAKADNRKGGADLTINGKGYQVKGMRATVCHGDNIENITREYATADGFVFGDLETATAYIMTTAEFVEFARVFGETTRESAKNGGTSKIRLNRKLEEQRDYLRQRVA